MFHSMYVGRYAIVALLAFGLTGCGSAEEKVPSQSAVPSESEPKDQPVPTEKPEPAPRPVAKTPTPAPPPVTKTPPPAPQPVAKKPPAPVPSPPAAASLRGDAAAGASLYQTYCSSCHGDGITLGPLGKALQPPPPMHGDSAFMSTLSDEQLYKAVKEGGAAVGKSPLMAPFGELIPDQGIKDLIAHMRKISGT